MYQRVLHVLAYASNQVNVVDNQFFEKALQNVSLVCHEFSEDLFRKLIVFQRGTIIRIDFATCGKSPKGFVSSRTLVVTPPNGGNQ